MKNASAVLQDAPDHWREQVEASTPNLRVLERPVSEEAVAELAVIPTPIRVRGKAILARFGPPTVFALTIAAIFWFWPPF